MSRDKEKLFKVFGKKNEILANFMDENNML